MLIIKVIKNNMAIYTEAVNAFCSKTCNLVSSSLHSV